MDTNEIVALSIVGIAIFLLARHFISKKGGGCCGSDCGPKFEKKDTVSKLEKK